jgi:DNA ligase-associated metallophosphoesterase
VATFFFYIVLKPGCRTKDSSIMDVVLQGTTFQLLKERAIFLPEFKLLVLSDLHLGKAGHFRKHGIPVPQSIHDDDLKRVSALIEKFHPTRVLFLGDLFHSDLNNEWWQLEDWLADYSTIHFLLAKGNHDIISEQLLVNASVTVADRFIYGPFSFSHIKELDDFHYNISGHIHPGVRLKGAGKQGITLPCFHFGKLNGLLPAFGNFTGLARIRPVKTDRIFVVTEESVIDVSPVRASHII